MPGTDQTTETNGDNDLDDRDPFQGWRLEGEGKPVDLNVNAWKESEEFRDKWSEASNPTCNQGQTDGGVRTRADAEVNINGDDEYTKYA